MGRMRYDIISDTHGYLPEELLAEVAGADMIVHAGDICSPSDYRKLSAIAPVQLCLGNNDYSSDYGPEVRQTKVFVSSGLHWQVCHYKERLRLSQCDIGICGHTHRPFVREDKLSGALVMNPGSPTRPRGCGPTMGRIVCEDGVVLSAQIIDLRQD